MLQTNPDDPKFINAVRQLSTGETLEVADGILEVEYLFDVPSHFPFHQRIFEPGMILKKRDSNVRIYIPYDQLNVAETEPIVEVERRDDGVPVEFDDKQVVDGEVLPAERGEGYVEEQ